MAGKQHQTSNDRPPEGGFEWQTKEVAQSEKGHDRRWRELAAETRRVGIIVGAAIIALGFIVLLVPGSSLAHTTFTADDVSVSGNAGMLQSLTIVPTGDVHYDGLEAAPSDVIVTVSAKRSDSTTWEEIGETSLAAAGREGSVNYSFADIDVLGTTSMKKQDFRAADGATEVTDVEVRIQATLVGAGPNGANVTTTSMAVMSVSVTNQAAGANAGGQANGQRNAA